MSHQDDVQKLDGSPVLDEADLAFLGESLTPVLPDPATRDRILSSVRARIAAERPDPPATRTVRADEGTWEDIHPGARQRVLFDDGVFRTMLVRLEAGARLPMHEHALQEECFVVEGDIWLSGVHMGRGDYQRIAAGTAHVDIRSDTGCLLHVRAQSPTAEAVHG